MEGRRVLCTLPFSPRKAPQVCACVSVQLVSPSSKIDIFNVKKIQNPSENFQKFILFMRGREHPHRMIHYFSDSWSLFRRSSKSNAGSAASLFPNPDFRTNVIIFDGFSIIALIPDKRFNFNKFFPLEHQLI